MDLVFRYIAGDGVTYSQVVTIPFEYNSKEEFIFDTLEKIRIAKEEAKKTDYGDYYSINLFNENMRISHDDVEGDIMEEDIESSTFTLDEWFKTYKETL